MDATIGSRRTGLGRRFATLIRQGGQQRAAATGVLAPQPHPLKR